MTDLKPSMSKKFVKWDMFNGSNGISQMTVYFGIPFDQPQVSDYFQSCQMGYAIFANWVMHGKFILSCFDSTLGYQILRKKSFRLKISENCETSYNFNIPSGLSFPYKC